MKIDIDLAPPDGWEIYGYGEPRPGDMIHGVGGWSLVGVGPFTYSACFLLARRRPTLSTWANEQKDFQDLARMRRPWITRLSHHGGDFWMVDSGSSVGPALGVTLPEPPSEIACLSVKLVNGRWEEV